MIGRRRRRRSASTVDTVQPAARTSSSGTARGERLVVTSRRRTASASSAMRAATVPDPSGRSVTSTRASTLQPASKTTETSTNAPNATNRREHEAFICCPAHAGSSVRCYSGAPLPASSTGGGSTTPFDRAEHDLFAVGVDDDRVAGVEFLPQDLLGQRVLDEALDRTAQRPGTERGVVAPLGEQQLRRVRELETETLRLELACEPLDQQVDDLRDLLGGELVEDDDVVDAVEELGPEVPLELVVHLLLHLVVGDATRRPVRTRAPTSSGRRYRGSTS